MKHPFVHMETTPNLQTAFAVWKENHKRAASCDSGTCNTQLYSQTEP